MKSPERCFLQKSSKQKNLKLKKTPLGVFRLLAVEGYYALVGTWTRDLSLTKGVLYRWATRAEKKWAGMDQIGSPAAQ